MLALFSKKVNYFGQQKTHRSGFLFCCLKYRNTVPKSKYFLRKTQVLDGNFADVIRCVSEGTGGISELHKPVPRHK